MSPHAPPGFSWVVPDTLAAMALPCRLRGSLEFLHEAGIRVIITLTRTPLQKPLIEEFGFEYHHVPIEDFTAPRMRQVLKFVRIVDNARREGRGCVTHCLAGQGRTGTMLACYLVSRGQSADAALAKVRELRPGSVETGGQERLVARYAARIARRGRKS